MTLHNPFRTETSSSSCQDGALSENAPKSKVFKNAGHPATGANSKWRGGNPNRRGNFRGRTIDRGRGRGRFNEALVAEAKPDDEFLCEACDRVFFNQTDLQEHTALHVRCPHCRFTSLHQLVDLHVKLVHEKYQASKVLEQSPEEIAEYLAERRKRFPLSRGGEEVDDDEKKGIIHEEDVRGNNGGRRNVFRQRKSKLNPFGDDVAKTSQRSRGPRKRRRGKAGQPLATDQVSQSKAEEQQCGVPKFNGLSLNQSKKTNAATNEDGISDSDEIQTMTPERAPTPATTSQALTVSGSKALLAIMECYSDSEDEVPAKVFINDSNGSAIAEKKVSSLSNSHNNIQMAHVQAERAAVDADVRKTVYSLVDKALAATTEQKKRNSRHRIPPPSHPNNKRKLSLLEKLLARDIRHERNILLQCVDYVIRMNFFDGQGFEA